MQAASKVADYFSVNKLINVRKLFKHRVHYGHKEGVLNPYMSPYVYGTRLGVSIIDLNQTVDKFKEALNVTASITYRGGIVMFVSNHKETGQLVEKTAMACGEYAFCRPYSEKALLDPEKFFGKVMRLPDLLIFLTTFDSVFLDHKMLTNAASTCIPTIGIADTNTDPRLLTYPIPANDDTPCAIELYCDLFKQAVLNVPAKFQENRASVSVKKGHILELECLAEGDEPVSIKWFKNSTQINKRASDRYEITDVARKDGVKSVLVVQFSEPSDEGLYQCTAENAIGKDEKLIKVSVIETPAIPTNFIFHQTWSRSARVSWDRPTSSKTPIINYIIQYWKISSQGKNERPHNVNVSSSMNYYILKDLHPCSTYEATIIAMNEVGESLPSKSIKFETGEEEPNSPPLDVAATALGARTIRVTWRAPPEHTWNGKLSGYLIGYKQSHDYKSPPSYHSVDAASQNVSYEYFLTHLLKDTTYLITVMAVNAAGNGPESSEVKVKTHSGDVPEPPIFHLLSASLEDVAIKYSLIKPKSSSIIHLGIHFKEADETFWKEFTFIPNNDDSGEYTLSNLNPNTYYMVYLTAANEVGDSDPSRIIRVRTAGSSKDSLVAKSYLDADINQYPILPVTIAFALVTIVIVVAFVYVRKVQIEANKPNVEFCSTKLPPGFVPKTDTLRFVGMDSEKPLMQANFSRMEGDYQFPVAHNTARRDFITDPKMGHTSTMDGSHTYSTPR